MPCGATRRSCRLVAAENPKRVTRPRVQRPTSPGRRRRRPMRRIKADGPRRKILQLRSTEAERQAALYAAALSGQTLTEFLRSCVLEKIALVRVDARATKREVTRHARSRPRLAQRIDWFAWNEARRIGVNLNQMMKHCHRHQVPPPTELRPLLEEIATLLRVRPD